MTTGTRTWRFTPPRRPIVGTTQAILGVVAITYIYVAVAAGALAGFGLVPFATTLFVVGVFLFGIVGHRRPEDWVVPIINWAIRQRRGTNTWTANEPFDRPPAAAHLGTGSLMYRSASGRDVPHGEIGVIAGHGEWILVAHVEPRTGFLWHDPPDQIAALDQWQAALSMLATPDSPVASMQLLTRRAPNDKAVNDAWTWARPSLVDAAPADDYEHLVRQSMSDHGDEAHRRVSLVHQQYVAIRITPRSAGRHLRKAAQGFETRPSEMWTAGVVLRDVLTRLEGALPDLRFRALTEHGIAEMMTTTWNPWGTPTADPNRLARPRHRRVRPPRSRRHLPPGVHRNRVAERGAQPDVLRRPPRRPERRPPGRFHNDQVHGPGQSLPGG